MKRAAVIALACALVRGGAVAGEAETATPVLVLLSIGGVDAELQQRVANYIEEQYLVRTVRRPAVPTAAGSAAELKRQLVDHAAADAAYLLALFNAPSIEEEILVFSQERCAAVNMTALRPEASAKDADEEVFARRVERESLRAIARLVGMPPCPFPRCALREHRTMQELDSNSRNPCPPCLTRIRKRLDALAEGERSR